MEEGRREILKLTVTFTKIAGSCHFIFIDTANTNTNNHEPTFLLSLNHIITIIMKLYAHALALSYAVAVTGGADDGISKKKTISNHLPLFRHETFLNIMETLRSNRYEGARDHQDRDLKSKGSKGGRKNQWQARLEKVEAELEVCKAEAATPTLLFVQMADKCTLYRDEFGVYHLESSKFHSDTEMFTDRPFQLEDTVPTADWFSNFDELFDDGKGMPNAALTIVDDDESKDVVVSVFAEAYTEKGLFDEGVQTYIWIQT